MEDFIFYDYVYTSEELDHLKVFLMMRITIDGEGLMVIMSSEIEI